MNIAIIIIIIIIIFTVLIKVTLSCIKLQGHCTVNYKTLVDY